MLEEKDMFDAYVRYFKEVIPSAVDKFMLSDAGGNGLQYPEVQNIEKPYGEFTWDELHLGSYHMTLTLRDVEVFNKPILDKAGIDPSWTSFDGKWYDFQGCVTGSCPPTLVVDLLTAGLNNIMDTRIKIAATWTNMVVGYWNGNYIDVAQVLSVPVFMLEQAVDAMALVKDIGEQQEVEEQRKRDLILSVISGILFVIPFVGEACALVAGATTLARVAAIAGKTANTAFSIYTIVEDPHSALLSLMGMLVGAGGVTAAFRDVASFTKMAKVRKSMTAGEAAQFGDLFRNNDDLLQSIISKCSI